MNARLTSIGFYLTCIIFFGFQSKPFIHTNNTLTPAAMVEYKIQPVEKGANFKSSEQKGNKNKKNTTGNTLANSPVNER